MPYNAASNLTPLLHTHKTGRLHHALLLHGGDERTLWLACTQIAEAILGTRSSPDFYLLRPTKKLRLIHISEMRALTQNLQKSSTGTHKVAVIWDADRLHTGAANAFLKTLEEPTKNTTLVLATQQLNAVLPTIKSRCMCVKIDGSEAYNADATWTRWLNDYREWLQNLQHPQVILRTYGLLSRFEHVLENLQPENVLPPSEDEDERDAENVSAQTKMRRRLFGDILTTTTQTLLYNAPERAPDVAHKIYRLEQLVRLTEVNFNPVAALETFLLTLLEDVI